MSFLNLDAKITTSSSNHHATTLHKLSTHSFKTTTSFPLISSSTRSRVHTTSSLVTIAPTPSGVKCPQGLILQHCSNQQPTNLKALPSTIFPTNKATASATSRFLSTIGPSTQVMSTNKTPATAKPRTICTVYAEIKDKAIIEQSCTYYPIEVGKLAFYGQPLNKSDGTKPGVVCGYKVPTFDSLVNKTATTASLLFACDFPYDDYVNTKKAQDNNIEGYWAEFRDNELAIRCATTNCDVLKGTGILCLQNWISYDDFISIGYKHTKVWGSFKFRILWI